jgi:cysteine desulfurase
VVNVRFPDVDSEALMLTLRDQVAISNGSACTSASYLPRYVLKAMGLDDERISSDDRISWGPGVTEIPAEPFIEAVRTLRA